ncbi:uncharacterized protein LOC134191347 isoform X2 [Corticium candelabrum]|uniref:uncharacterized protein LOC134191347 isoform X2 n=1 Tax=Corticium candelabrum TaxID=121492 RepID=UPI002E27042C|nr:uncharacterized protein LOC134191347 isoform X2 [Corticium candelabrum]
MEIHPTSEAVIKTVARKLRYYMDVRRRELDFDLSGPQKPRPCWKEPGVQDSVARFFHSQHDRHVKHYFRQPEVKKHLQYMEHDASNLSGSRESVVRLEIEDEMDRLAQVPHSTPTTGRSTEHRHSGNRKRRSRRSSLDSSKLTRTSTSQQVLYTKTRTHSASRLMHQRHQSSKNCLTTGKAEHLLTTASRLIVATETVVLNESGRDWTKGRQRQRKSPDQTSLPSVGCRMTAWTQDTADGNIDDIHLAQLSSSSMERMKHRGHQHGQLSGGSTPEAVTPRGMTPVPPPAEKCRRGSNLQHLSNSSLYKRRVSTFPTNFGLQLQQSDEAIGEESNPNDEPSRKTSDIETAVGVVNEQTDDVNEMTESSRNVEKPQMEDTDGVENPDKRNVVNDDIQVIDLQEENAEAEEGKLENEVSNTIEERDVANSVSDEIRDESHDKNERHTNSEEADFQDSDTIGKEVNEQIGNDMTRELETSIESGEVARDKDEQEQSRDAADNDKLVEERVANVSNSVDQAADIDTIISKSNMDVHPLMVDVATQTANDKSTQTSDEITDRDSASLLEPVSTEKLIQEAGKVLKLLQVLPSFVEYELEVHTGHDPSAGTTAAVQVVIFGDGKHSNVQHLEQSLTHRANFQTGNVDVFTIRCTALGRLKGLKVWHDNTGTSPSWFLEKMVVREGKDGIADFVFDCYRWLTANESDVFNSVEETGTFAMLPCTGIVLKGIASREMENALFAHTTRYSPEAFPQVPVSSNCSFSANFVSSSPGLNATSNSGQAQSASERQSVVTVQQGLGDERPGADGGDQLARKTTQHETTNVDVAHEVSVETEDSGVGHEEQQLIDQQLNTSAANVDDTQVVNKDSNLPSSSSQVELETEREHESTSPQPVDLDQIDEAIRSEALKRHLSAIKLQQFFKGFVAGSKASKSPTKSFEEKLQESKQEEEDVILRDLQRGSTIHQAARDGNLARLEALLDHNSTLISSTDEHGQSLLHLAAASGHVDCVKLLVARGGKLDDFTPTGYYPIHLAAMNGHVHCLQLLKGLGSHLSLLTIDKQTPLHLAAARGLVESCRWLIANRADLNAVDNNDRTSVDVAKEYGHDECVKLLEECKKDLRRRNSGLSLLIASPRLSRQHDIGKEQEMLLTSSHTETENRLNDQQDDEGWMSDDNVVVSEQDRKEPLSTSFTLEEKRVVYDKHHLLMKQRDSSFLDSIRQEIEDNLTDETTATDAFSQDDAIRNSDLKQIEEIQPETSTEMNDHNETHRQTEDTVDNMIATGGSKEGDSSNLEH